MAQKNQKQASKASEKQAAKDVETKKIDNDTVVETKTVVEDRTEEPAEKKSVKVKASEQELNGGTILTEYE